MKTHVSESDAIIIGGGHNGLVCASYLAKAGLSVRLFEARERLGRSRYYRGVSIQDFAIPGLFRILSACCTPQVIADLLLEQHGLEIMERPAGTLSLLENDHLLLTRDEAQGEA